MNTEQHKPPHENEAERTVVRFDDGARRTARPVVPLSRASLEIGRGRRRRGSKWPLGLILGLGFVTALAALAGTLYREERPQATAAAPAPAPAPDTPSTAHLDIAQAATGAASQAEAAPESPPATAESDAVGNEAAAAPARTRGRRFSSNRYATGRIDRHEDDNVEQLLKRAERVRKEAEERAGRDGDGPPKARLVGVYTLRSRY